MSPATLDLAVVLLSAEVAGASFWLGTMLLIRTVRAHDRSWPSIATVVYVLSSAIVFTMIAAHGVWLGPWQMIMAALLIKAISCTATGVYVYLRMRAESSS